MPPYKIPDSSRLRYVEEAGLSTSRISWRPSFAALLAYAVAILSVTTALVTGLLLDQFLQTMPYVSLFLCSIMFAAWFGGFGPSLLATGIAILLFTYYFVDPGGSFEVAAKDVPRVALFTITALFVVSLSAAQRRNADSLRFARDELQATVEELARVNRALEAENAQRRRVEAYLDEAQELSRTGSFSWKVSSGDAFWSKEGYRILGLDQAAKPSIDLLLQRVHPDDQRTVQHEIDRVRQGEQDYDYELRWLMPNGPTKHLRVRAHRVRFDVGEDEIVGALIDVSEAREAQESLHAAQTALAHAARVATLGEMSASIAHEVNQPLAGIVTNGEAGLRWLDRKEPELGEIRSALERIIRDGKRASQVVERLRALARKAPQQTALLDLNEVISEGVALVQREIQGHRVALQLDLARDLPSVLAGRVELQQVVINLMMNGVQAMEPVTDRPRRLVVRSFAQAEEVLVSVQDSGIGIDPENMGRLFNAFFTTRTNGMGMGLSIGRSIIESYGGRIWASSNDGAGTTFQFALPVRARGAA
jgi:C4-dicarboxylate-specific signal transduction histidine kinase